jgi:hypothetical protein
MRADGEPRGELRSGRARADEPVRLGWVVVGGALRPVAAFAGAPPRGRPPAACPVCGEPVVLKLGAVMAPHAAHRADSACALGREETALHYNTKQHLAAALRVAAASPGAGLRVRQWCAHRGGVLGETIWSPGAVPCPAFHERPLAGAWDAVDVEVGLSDTRPDIVLRAGGAPVAVVEVRRTHAVTAAKIERLAAAGVPWAEVVASRALYAEFTAWDASRPLTVLRAHDGARWWCDYHRGRADRAARAADAADAPWVARVVDRYHPDGRAERDVAYVTGVVARGRVASPTLRARSSDVPLAVLADGGRDAVLRAAHEAFRAWAAGRRRHGERVDSPMSWVDASRLHTDDGAWLTGAALFPRRYAFDRAAGAWVRRPRLGGRAWTLAEALGPAAHAPRRAPPRRPPCADPGR